MERKSRRAGKERGRTRFLLEAKTRNTLQEGSYQTVMMTECPVLDGHERWGEKRKKQRPQKTKSERHL